MLRFTYFKEKYAVVLLSIAIGILIIAPAAYFRYWDGGYRGIDFFGSGDEDFYLAQIQEIYDGHWFSGNIYLAENKNDSYVLINFAYMTKFFYIHHIYILLQHLFFLQQRL